MKRLPALLLSSCLLLPSAPAVAASLVRIDIVDREQGRWLPEYRARGEAWIAGTPGHRYAVRLTNTSGERVLAVLSIDSVNALPARPRPSQPGYVLEPGERRNRGLAQSWQDVAAFVFTSPDRSYTADRASGQRRHHRRGGVPRARRRLRCRAHRLPGARVARRPRRRGAGRARRYASPSRVPQQLGTGHARAGSPAGQATRAREPPARAAHPAALRRRGRWRRGIGPRDTPRARPARPAGVPGGFVPDPPAVTSNGRVRG